jgi:hypothetical protein
LWSSAGGPGGDGATPKYTPLPGEGIVSSFLKNLPPPPTQEAAGAAGNPGGVGPVGDPPQPSGPTLAAPSQHSQPTAPQFPAAKGDSGGSFQVPPYVGAGNAPTGTASEGRPAGGVFPTPNANAADGWGQTPGGHTPGGHTPDKPRPVSPPTLYDRTPAPIVDPDASKGGNKGSEKIAEEESPSDRLDRLAANVTVPKDAASQKPTIDEKTAQELAQAEAAKPWMPLVLTSFALFASLAANMYLGWIAVGIYRRYRAVVGQLHQARTAPA